MSGDKFPAQLCQSTTAEADALRKIRARQCPVLDERLDHRQFRGLSHNDVESFARLVPDPVQFSSTGLPTENGIAI